MISLAKILLTVAAIQYGAVPLIVDLTESHVFHPDWPPHARFHMVWLLGVGALLAIYTLALIWGPGKSDIRQLRHASVLGCLTLAAFFSATFLAGSYGGSLSDMETPIRVMGVDGNLFAFSVAAILQGLGTGIVWTRRHL
ncbi:MAG: hypothetical protein COA62_00425 [Rhodobiaceae bacterium]|nr:MAG: hypothetical protein COA62_00425 [Rhodobiaceae bacterium]